MVAGAPEDQRVSRYLGHFEVERQDSDCRFAEEHQADAGVAQRADGESREQLWREYLRSGESSESRADAEDGRGVDRNFAATREGRRRGGVSGTPGKSRWRAGTADAGK